MANKSQSDRDTQFSTDRRGIRAIFTNEVIRAIGALARQQKVCREQDGKVVFVSGMDAAREYIVEQIIAHIVTASQEASWRDFETSGGYATAGRGLPPPDADIACPECAAGNGPHTLAHEGKP